MLEFFAKLNKILKYNIIVKPLNSGHIGDRTLVSCREVVLISEADWLATLTI